MPPSKSSSVTHKIIDTSSHSTLPPSLPYTVSLREKIANTFAPLRPPLPPPPPPPQPPTCREILQSLLSSSDLHSSAAQDGENIFQNLSSPSLLHSIAAQDVEKDVETQLEEEIKSLKNEKEELKAETLQDVEKDVETRLKEEIKGLQNENEELKAQIKKQSSEIEQLKSTCEDLRRFSLPPPAVLAKSYSRKT